MFKNSTKNILKNKKYLEIQKIHNFQKAIKTLKKQFSKITK